MEAHHSGVNKNSIIQKQPWWTCYGSVQDLFGKDWVCRWMIGLFGRLRIGAFILFWALVMVMIPLATGKLANARFGFSTSYWMALVLFPVLGAWLGYQWFVSIVQLPQMLVDRGQAHIAPAYRSAHKIMRHPLAYFLALAATAGVAAGVYPILHMPILAKWISIIAYGLWWYFIIRTLTLALAVFWDLRHWIYDLGTSDNGGLPESGDLFDLNPYAEQMVRFLGFYLFIIGPYLIYFSDRLWRNAPWLCAAVWVIYLALPLYVYGTVFRAAAGVLRKTPRAEESAKGVVHGLNKAFWQYLKFNLFRKAI